MSAVIPSDVRRSPLDSRYSRLRCTLVVAAWLAASSAARGAEPAPVVSIRLAEDATRVEVAGLPAPVLAALANARRDDDSWSRVLAVAVAADGAAPMLGAYATEGNAITFTPRFPLRRGLEYRAVFDPAALPGKPLTDLAPVEMSFTLPMAPAGPAAAVVAVYPSGDVLPANLLKFYLHFTTPMSRGDSYRRLRIVDDAGRDVPDAFLELGEELWDSTGTRLTLLFDPGRIKRGLKPHDDVGVPLVEGRRYAFLIAASWPDATGRPLSEAFHKAFRVVAADYRQPDPLRWRIVPPRPRTLEPLTVTFDEPLDRALAERLLAVRDAAGRDIDGAVAVDERETRWRFRPHDPWHAGPYELIVDAALEDRAGNSVGRPFETSDDSRPAAHDPVALPFTVAAP